MQGSGSRACRVWSLGVRLSAFSPHYSPCLPHRRVFERVQSTTNSGFRVLGLRVLGFRVLGF